MEKGITSAKVDLKKHILAVHENVRDYQCDICKKAFPLKGDLNKHVQTVHEKIQAFQCQLCNHAHSSKSNLRKHILTKFINRPSGEEFSLFNW